MVVYEKNGVILAAGFAQPEREKIHGHQVPAGAICVQMTTVRENVKAPFIFGYQDENSIVTKGGFHVFPINFLQLAVMDPIKKCLSLTPYSGT